MWIDQDRWAGAVNVKTVEGQWGIVYAVNTVGQVDGHLRNLLRMKSSIAKTATEDTLKAMLRCQREIDILLDARLEVME